MNNISVNKFSDNLRHFVEQVIYHHAPLKVTRRSGEDFVIISAENWERNQETLYVLQNTQLMQQINESTQTHADQSGYTLTVKETSETLDI